MQASAKVVVGREGVRWRVGSFVERASLLISATRAEVLQGPTQRASPKLFGVERGQIVGAC